MTKAWCIYCETGQIPKHGYFWICPECFERVESIVSNIKAVEKYLKGELPRITNAGNQLGKDTVEQYLIDMYDFDRRWRNIRKLVDANKAGIPIDQVDFELKTSNGSTQDE